MKNALKITFFLFLAMACFVSGQSRAEEATTPEKYVKIRLLPERGTIQPGEEIWIGIEQVIAPHWHTYWENPGDSGSPPGIDWTLPEGFSVGKLQFPAPKRLPFGPLLNFGYEGNVVLLQKLKAPETLPQGPIILKADIDILVCQEICIPEFGTYELTLNQSGVMPEDNAAFISMARGKLPQKAKLLAEYSEHDNLFALEISSENPEFFQNTANVEFYPLEWGLVSNPDTPRSRIEDGRLVIEQKRGERPLSEVESLPGVLVLDGSAYKITATPQSGAPVKTQPAAAAEAGSVTLMAALVLALFGGMILNLMPCVFPVLSIKALSLVKIAEKHPEAAKIHGISYTAGVVLSFLLIAGVLIVLKAGGAEIGWGFQLQNSVVVTLLAYLLFIIGLNLMGLFEIALGGFTDLGSNLTRGANYHNSFFTGVLATLVATPCTAPFMGAALGFALVQPAPISLLVFAALGFGLALPYLLISVVPALQKTLPKPGPWMDIFKQFLAFPMFASAAWLIWVLSQQAGPMGTFGALLGLVSISFGIWLLRHAPKRKALHALVIALAIFSFVSAFAFLPAADMKGKAEMPAEFGEVFSPEKLENLLAGDGPVFTEMTAAWCITCKVNHAVAINTDSTKDLFKANNISYLIGDWTNQDPVITHYLNSFGRNGVPLYVYYGPRDAQTGDRPEPKLLPQILTPAIVADTIKN